MTAPQNRQRWLFGGGAGCLILISLCIVGLWLYFIGADQFIFRRRRARPRRLLNPSLSFLPRMQESWNCSIGSR